ncbi:MAG: GGDEF domain-containing protein [Gemmatimonadetes bacterium]|nr:GGDEF domain-containing protein [Gemmatimonadota bacterium]NNM05197.1 GGDEF domain-containing protein [Gemmatimonadota bacterium]
MSDQTKEPFPPESISELDPGSWNPREILGDVELVRHIPLRALWLSFAALSIPVSAAMFFPTWASADAGLLMWLTALVPAFLLTYYRGWQGASLALGMGMAALILTQVALVLGGIKVHNWALLTGIVFVYVATSLGIGWVTELLHMERRRAERLALMDPLTGMPNRRHSVVFIEAAFAAAKRGIPLTVVLFDVDRFKAYNDTRGHLAGDEALKTIAQVLVGSTRKMNLTARWGGEEFLSMLSDTPVEGGRIFAERVLSEIHQAFSDGSLTLSAGVARFNEKMDTPTRLLAAADQAMYEAKAAGGDCVKVAGHGP